MYLRTCGSFKSANHKKDWVCKSQIHKVPHLRKVRNANVTFLKVRKLADLRNLFADHRYLRFDECFLFFHVSPSVQVVSQLGSAGANAQDSKKTGARETFPVDPVTLP
jgi:hypothetical protein